MSSVATRVWWRILCLGIRLRCKDLKIRVDRNNTIPSMARQQSLLSSMTAIIITLVSHFSSFFLSWRLERSCRSAIEGLGSFAHVPGIRQSGWSLFIKTFTIHTNPMTSNSNSWMSCISAFLKEKLAFWNLPQVWQSCTPSLAGSLNVDVQEQYVIWTLLLIFTSLCWSSASVCLCWLLLRGIILILLMRRFRNVYIYVGQDS